MGFDRRGGFEGFDDCPVERSVLNISDGPGKVGYLPIEHRFSSETVEDGKRIRASMVESFQVYEKLPRTPENLAALRPSKER